MSKKRIYEYAKDLKLKSKDIIDELAKMNVEVTSHMQTLEDDQIKALDKIYKPEQAQQAAKSEQKSAQNKQSTTNNKNNQGNKGNQNNKPNNKKNNKNNKNTNKNNKQPKQPKQEEPKEIPSKITYHDGITVGELAEKLNIDSSGIIKKLFLLGIMANINQSLDDETLELIVDDYGVEIEKEVIIDEEDLSIYFEDEADEENGIERPAVVTIMGHVDHGKTTLLDSIRHTKVTAGEAGGITQHIGAYQIENDGKKITFLDTPGHAAFTTMRARGAQVTDITILVVAADDGVMPQTIEAINHSKAAGVPIIVAINKIDKPGANPQRVTQELTEHGVFPVAWDPENGSEFVEISAKFNQNLDELLDTVLLVAEVQELKADPTVRAIGTVVEARLDQGKGAIATLLVQQGTLHVQDPIVVGNTYGRVRTMTNDLGRRIKEAGPSTPIELTGLSDVPQAGDHFAVFEDEKAARAAGEERAKRAQLIKRQNTRRVNLDNLFDTLKEGQTKSVNIIIKADVQGSAEALAASLQKIEVEGVKVDIVHSAVGAISESDISLAAASNAIIIGFNVRPTGLAREQAAQEEVDIRLHSIIYKVIEEVETAMRGMLDPEFKEEIIGEAIVRETFNVSKVGTIAGFMVIRGKVARDTSVRVIREGVVIHDGAIASLKHFKDDVKEVGNAQEGGLMVEDFNDVEIDDTFEVYKMVEIERK